MILTVIKELKEGGREGKKFVGQRIRLTITTWKRKKGGKEGGGGGDTGMFPQKKEGREKERGRERERGRMSGLLASRG